MDRATILEGVPTMFADLLSHPDLGSYDLSSLRAAISGGASIPAQVLDAFEERFGLVILEGYGMRETASTITSNFSAAERPPARPDQPGPAFCPRPLLAEARWLAKEMNRLAMLLVSLRA
jgi:acyl-CoA synthetase (AMP-forming)/AMP-acid ligase II